MDENDLPEPLLNRGIVTVHYLLHVLLLESEEAEPPAKHTYLEELLSKEDMLIQERQQPNPLDSELESYQMIPRLSKECDPLEFWIKRKEQFPLLSKIAVDILVIPASSAPIERVFSRAGYASRRRRNRIEDHQLEREVMIKYNTELFKL